jgi:hypothetical protein
VSFGETIEGLTSVFIEDTGGPIAGAGRVISGNRKLPGSFAHAEATDRRSASRAQPRGVGVDAKACTRRNKICAKFTPVIQHRLANLISPRLP